jgi:hypothetical protein
MDNIHAGEFPPSGCGGKARRGQKKGGKKTEKRSRHFCPQMNTDEGFKSKNQGVASGFICANLRRSAEKKVFR